MKTLVAIIVGLFLSHSFASELISNHLKVALVNLEPFCFKDEKGHEKGFLVDLLKDLLHRVNTSGTQTVTYETYWISLSNDSSESDIWDKVRGHLLSGEADMALVPLADTVGWNGVVQLSQPYLLSPFLPLVSRLSLSSQANGRATSLEKLRQGQLKGIVVSGSSIASLIEKDSRTPVKNLRDALAAQGNHTQVATYANGIAAVRSQPERNVLIGEELRLRQYVLEGKNCDLTFDWEAPVGIGAYTLPISLFVQSQPLISSINTNLLRMRQDGTIARLKAKWWHGPLDAACKPIETGSEALRMLNSLF